MQTIVRRLAPLRCVARPLLLAAIGVLLLSIGIASFGMAIYRATGLPTILQALTLPFLSHWQRGIASTLAGLIVLVTGFWQLRDMRVPLPGLNSGDGIVGMPGQQRAAQAPRVVVISGGAGLLILAGLGRVMRRLTCITPPQHPVEYYYRASSLYNFENVVFLPPCPMQIQVGVELDDGSRHNIRDNLAHNPALARRHVSNSFLIDRQPAGEAGAQPALFRQALDVISQADVIVLGPGSLFESIVPNLLIPELSAALRQSKARKIYICNLMTEPGLTDGFSVAAHIRQIVRYGGFAPDYVLVNAQHIDTDVRRIYAAARQIPVYLNPEEYEETMVSKASRGAASDIVVEDAVVIECDLASSVLQLTASLEHPGDDHIVRVLRHDPEKLSAAILTIMQRD